MAIKKTLGATRVPGTHPALMERLRDAEMAELRGETPRQVDDSQTVTRPSLKPTTTDRIEQTEAIGLVDAAHLHDIDDTELRRSLAQQTTFRPGADLDAIWDTLSETDKIRAGAVERFRLEMEVTIADAAMPWKCPHEIAGKLNKRNLDRAMANLGAEIDAYDYLLAADSRALLERFVAETRALIAVGLREPFISGIAAGPLYEILRDWVHKLIYQEVVSRRRAMGDRGIRRICANIELADTVYEALKYHPVYAPRQQLLMRMIHVHQDLGYTSYAARVSYRGTKMHRAYSARIFTDELNRYRGLFKHHELTAARLAIATHSSHEFPFSDARVVALVRTIDHLAPFGPHRVFKHFETIDGCAPLLDNMLDAVQKRAYDTLPELRRTLANHLLASDVEATLRDDLMASFRPFEKMADPIDLGSLAGQVANITYEPIEEPGALHVTLSPDAFAHTYQILFETQQDQLLRLARSCDISPATLRTGEVLRFQAPDFGALTLSPESP